jgi:glycosyltransferase involved in cell wall biosynthesis
MRKVVINSRIRYRGVNGTATVINEMEAVLRTDNHISLTMLEGPPPVSRPGRLGRVLRLAQSVWWDGWMFGRTVEADVAIFPTTVGGWCSRARTNVLVVHDLMALDKRLGFDRGFRLSSMVTWPISVWFADVIVTPSRWTRAQVVARWPSARHKAVIMQYASRLASRSGAPRQWDASLRPTVVMVSATEPHKDHARGIAVVQMARTISGVDFALTIVGPRGRAETAVTTQMALRDPDGAWISRLVDVDDDHLVKILDDGFALLNTSKAEGFGLPLLEASARDLPVVHSRTGSMNEVIRLDDDSPVSTLSLAYELVELLDATRFREAVERGRAAIRARSAEDFAVDLLRVITGAS